ncbi:MAG: hypothetical protein PHX74_12650 [Candidatus Sumerlaeales bacterium]|nr:hypothetical protein [Candidatus Sumerlaeales bacterium]
MIAQIQIRRGTTAEWAAASPVVLAAGEPGWDSTLEGMKVGDGSTEWAALPWIDAKNRPDINADTLDGFHLVDIRRGQNLLHNWDFRNPVNQRAISGTITTAGYFYDRWMLNSGSVVTNAAYLTLGAGTEIEQRIEGNLLAGETVTVSVMAGGMVFIGTGAMPISGTASVTLAGWGTATLGYATGYMYVRLSPTAASNVVRVKLEFGTVSTLAYDPPTDYGTELAKCMRYFQVLGNYYGFPGYAFATQAAIVFIYLPVPMRISPSVSNNSFTMVQNGTVFLGTYVNGVMSPSGFIKGNVTIADGSMQATAPILGYFEGTPTDLSADL